MFWPSKTSSPGQSRDKQGAAATSGDTDDDTLIRRCQDNERDATAFEQLYRRYAGKVYRHLVILLSGRPEVEDAMQTVFTEAFRSIRRYDGRASFNAWLRGVTVNVARNTIRASARRNRAMDALADESNYHLPRVPPTPEIATQRDEVAARVNRQLDKLPADRQMAFLLYYVEELEISEVAVALKVSPAVAWAHIRRARAALLESLARDEKVAARRRWRRR